MKRKLSIIFIILICICALTFLSSCDLVLDLIFGPSTPSDKPDTNEPPAHKHTMVAQMYTGATCVGQDEINYFKCSGCNKYYFDEAGNEEIADISALEKGHLFVIKSNSVEHYSECKLCNTEQENSRGQHSSTRWWYNVDRHYKVCDVCGSEFNSASHDETGSCSVCGRQADYKAICNGNYAYEQLALLENGGNMQKLYNKIDELASSVHDDVNTNATKREIGETADGTVVEAYAFNAISTNGLGITAVQAYVTVASYNHDHPLYYWIDKQCSVSVSQITDKVSSVTICADEKYATGEARSAQNKILYNQIDKYLSLMSDESDPYYITLGLHDAIIDDINYAYKSDGVTAETASWAHNIVGVFDNKSAVCEGYAKAFQLLLNACNVNNVYVTGSSKGIGHAWNTVQLADDNWYWYDLTWDDQPNMVNGKMYDYFCKTDNVFSVDHTVTEQNVNDQMNYLYNLPKTATLDYSSENLEIDEQFTYNGVTYILAGYNRLAVNKVLTAGTDGVVMLPSEIVENGKKFAVKQINDEALATYTYGENGSILSVASPSVTKLVIPQSVDVIFNKSFVSCKTLAEIDFEDKANWQRYALFGKPDYKTVTAEQLSATAEACKLMQEVYKPNVLSPSYVYVWVKTA